MAALHQLVRDELPWADLNRALDRGILDALVVAATEVAAGRCYYFMDRRVPGPPIDLPYPEEVVIPTRLGPQHTLASAAIPFSTNGLREWRWPESAHCLPMSV